MKKNKNKKNTLKVILFFIYLSLIWGAYRAFMKPDYLLDELFYKPILWLLPTFFIVLKLEKEKLTSLGMVFQKPLKSILLGIGISIFILGEYMIAFKLKGREISLNPQKITLLYWPIYLLACIATGMVEEITFRGFFMTRINRVIKDKLFSNIITGLLFFLIHLPILFFVQQANIRGIAEFFILSVSLGIIDGYVFWKTKGILAPIVAHSTLNFLSLIVG